MVSRPSDSGITSSSSSSPAVLLPGQLMAWMAAPSATTSSGLRLVSGSLPKSRPRLAHLGHAGGAADHDHALHLVAAQVCILERAAHGRKVLLVK
jgi:hypothetical protein